MVISRGYPSKSAPTLRAFLQECRGELRSPKIQHIRSILPHDVGRTQLSITSADAFWNILFDTKLQILWLNLRQ